MREMMMMIKPIEAPMTIHNKSDVCKAVVVEMILLVLNTSGFGQ